MSAEVNQAGASRLAAGQNEKTVEEPGEMHPPNRVTPGSRGQSDPPIPRDSFARSAGAAILKASTAPWATAGNPASALQQPGAIAGVNMSSAGQPPTTPFTRQVRQNFAQWDANGNGFLSRAEIDKAMQSSSIHGNDAAALYLLKFKLAALEEFGNDEMGDENDGVTLNDLREIEKRTAAGDREATTLGAWFSYASTRSKNIVRTLFATASPDPNAVRQGHIGDCYFLSAVSGLAGQNPQAIRTMITNNNDGSFTVGFPGRDPVTVQQPTDAEILTFSNSGSDGTWLAVLEKAYGQLRNDQRFFTRKTQPHDAADVAKPLSEGISVLTGHDTDTDVLSLTSMDTTRQKLQQTLTQGRLATAGTRRALPFESHDVNGIPRGHAYTVVGYNQNTDTVTLRNPWGFGEPMAGGRALDGTSDGIFRMNVQQFHDTFLFACYEEPR